MEPFRGDSELSPRATRLLILALLVFKLAIMAWNSAVFDGITYDQAGLHVPRARAGGLTLKGRAYNPPIYYLPALPVAAVQDAQAENDPAAESKKAKKVRRKARDKTLLTTLRWTNVLHVGLFYWCWLFWILPRLLPPRQATVASLLLLALPGYQKLGAMVHPDNALTSATAACIALWLWLRAQRGVAEEGKLLRGVVILAGLAGLAGLTRPFGVLTMAAFWVAAGVLLYELGLRGQRLWTRVALVTALALGLGTAWYSYQWATQGELEEVYSKKYITPYVEHRDGFDRVGYFTSFHVVDLLRRPNRTLVDLDEDAPDEYQNRYGNSFFTLAYSEIWGDHWLYFSGKWKKEMKAWPKRILFALALPTLPWIGLRFFRGLWLIVGFVRRRTKEAWPWLFLAGLFTLGVALFLYWQLTGGLTPGKNSGVKFIYNAYIFPIPIAIAMLGNMKVAEYRVGIVYALVLYAFALPIAMFWPTW